MHLPGPAVPEPEDELISDTPPPCPRPAHVHIVAERRDVGRRPQVLWSLPVHMYLRHAPSLKRQVTLLSGLQRSESRPYDFWGSGPDPAERLRKYYVYMYAAMDVKATDPRA